jgi:D-sedoheptulose 7-phosphate isomerase
MTITSNSIKLKKSPLIPFLDEQEKCIKKIKNDADIIEEIIRLLIDARNKGKRIFTMGNGGSGSTASHFVSDLLKTAITKGHKRFSAISLVDNIPVILAWSNDVSYEEVFVEQLQNHLNKDDILIGFSGSGRSKNVVKAFKYGKKTGAFCIGITGMSGGEFPKICDLCYVVPSDNMLTIESIHLLVCHCIIQIIRSMGKPVFKYE